MTRIYEAVAPLMDERARRRWAAVEAQAYGWGGIRAVAAATGLSPNTIRRGLAELGQGGDSGPRIRRRGGGRKRRAEESPDLLPTLDRLVSGGWDPRLSCLRWSCESTASLADELGRLGHTVSPRTVGRMLRDAGYRLEGNRPNSPRTDNGRRSQFEYVARMVDRFSERGQPVVAVAFRGRATRAGGQDPRESSPEKTPRRDQFSARFAAQAVGAWWQDVGSSDRPSAEELLVVVDGCGSDAGRRRACKAAFSALPAKLGLPLRVCHLPPGIVRWPDADCRTYSKTSRAGRGQEPARHEVVIRLLVVGRPGPAAGGVVPDRTPDGNADGREATPEHSTRPALKGDWNYRLLPSRTGNRST